MTPTERKYSIHVGRLYWSYQRGSLVMITSLTKNYGRWRYNIDYLSPDITQGQRTRDAKEILRLMTKLRWVPAAQYIKEKEISQLEKSP